MEFEHTEVFNFRGALRGMRNPWESWNRSDSVLYDSSTTYSNKDVTYNDVKLGENDFNLMSKLIKGGPEHRKFMRQIFVCVDITAPLYFWKEFDTYKVGTTSNSTSTMHKIATTPINESCFEIDLETLEENKQFNSKAIWGDLIISLESIRQLYLETHDKKYWKLLIQLLPESWRQTRTITMSYENVSNMLSQRKGHKLTEWSKDFYNWAMNLPYAKDLFIGAKNDD